MVCTFFETPDKNFSIHVEALSVKARRIDKAFYAHEEAHFVLIDPTCKAVLHFSNGILARIDLR